jgi:hypothetical protein
MTTEIRKRALTMERIDTHSHFRGQDRELKDIAEEFVRFNPRFTSKSDNRIIAEGCRRLYGIDPGAYVRPDSPAEIFEKAAELRANGLEAAFEKTLDACNISTQLLFTDHRPQDSPLLWGMAPRVRILAYVDELIAGEPRAFCPDGYRTDFCYYDEICKHLGLLDSLDDYLGAMDSVVETWCENGVVGMKTALAYTIGLRFSDPSENDVRNAFEKKGKMSPAEVRMVRDFAFRHALLACKRNELPILIHTGAFAWGRSPLTQGNPMELYDILVDNRYKDVTFVLLHGGLPSYSGETTYLAGICPNVIIDFTAAPWCFRSRFRTALGEWLEWIPDNRFCFGSDSTSIETVAGADIVSREAIADVLEDLVKKRVTDVRTALDFLEMTYLETPKRIFCL